MNQYHWRTGGSDHKKWQNYFGLMHGLAQQKTYERLIPPGAMQAQRDLFVMEMETILYILAWQDRVDHSSGRTLL